MSLTAYFLRAVLLSISLYYKVGARVAFAYSWHAKPRSHTASTHAYMASWRVRRV